MYACIAFEYDLESGDTFHVELGIDITNLGSRATRHYPGDPIEWEIDEVEGMVELEDGEREPTEDERELIRGIAHGLSEVEDQVVDLAAEIHADMRNGRRRW